ncbi:unnamed protein product [Parajaminaea phylloscopi]
MLSTSASPAPAASPSSSSATGPLPASLRSLILDMLSKSDLDSVTPRALRSDLISIQNSQKFSPPADVSKLIPAEFDFTANKRPVTDLIKECYSQVVGQTSAPASAVARSPQSSSPAPKAAPASSSPPKASPGNGLWGGGIALPGLGGVRGSHAPPAASEPSAVNAPKYSSKPPQSKESQAASDAALAAQLQKQWSEAGPSTRGSAAGAKATKPKKRKANAKADPDAIDSEEDSDVNSNNGTAGSAKKRKSAKSSNGSSSSARASNPNNPFNRPVLLSPLMAEICGGDEMPRHGVVKQLWAYIKGRDLQNPSNKRQIQCDDKLTKLFGKSVVDSFEMSKLIGSHLKKKEDVVGQV